MNLQIHCNYLPFGTEEVNLNPVLENGKKFQLFTMFA